MTVTEGYTVIKQIREQIMDRVPNVIDVTTLLTPKGEYLRQFLGSEDITRRVRRVTSSRYATSFFASLRFDCTANHL